MFLKFLIIYSHPPSHISNDQVCFLCSLIYLSSQSGLIYVDACFDKDIEILIWTCLQCMMNGPCFWQVKPSPSLLFVCRFAYIAEDDKTVLPVTDITPEVGETPPVETHTGFTNLSRSILGRITSIMISKTTTTQQPFITDSINFLSFSCQQVQKKTSELS